MPTRQEVLDALRVVAEEVLSSLRSLLTLIFMMTKAVEPEMEVNEAQMNPVNQLIAEVTAQRHKIEQLGTLIQTQFQKPPTTPGYASSPVQEIGSESDWEEAELANMTAHPGKRQSLAQSSNRNDAMSGPKFFPSNAYGDDSNANSSSASSASSSDAQEVPATTIDARHQNIPGKHCKPTAIPGRIQQFRDWKPVDGHSGHFGKLGSKDRGLGKETSGQELLHSLRPRSKLCAVGFGKSPQHGRRHAGFRSIRHRSTAVGAIGNATVSGDWECINHIEADNPKDMKERSIVQEVHEVMMNQEKGPYQLDLLEVYASPNSMLTTVAQQCGLRARRFTMSDGDLSTPEGRRTLLNMIQRYRPKHVWMSLECKPWCAWNRFNAGRSVQLYSHVMEQQRASRQHVILCKVISKIQHDAGRHTHMENPRTSGVWELQELRTFIRRSVPASVDQCMFGLKHPETRLPMQKQTRIQTTSMELFQEIDHRTCTKNHTHSVIAGSCHWKGHRIHVSRFAAFYPRLFARAIVRGIMKTSHTPYEEPICHVDTVEEPPNKRPRHHESQLDVSHDTTNVWKPVFDVLKRQLPKSGVITLNNPQEEVFTEIQKRLPHETLVLSRLEKGSIVSCLEMMNGEILCLDVIAWL